MSTPFFKSFVFSCFFCYFVTFIFGPAPFAFRSFAYADTLDAGTLNVQLERIPLNALAPVLAVVSFVPEIVTFDSLLHL